MLALVPELHVLRVFTDLEGRHGNPLGVVLDGPAVAPERRQAVAARLGFSETVFVDDADRGEAQIFTPEAELPFAGHPSVGTAWLLEADVLRLRAGEVRARREGELVWIAGRPEWGPPFRHVRLGSPAEVDAHPGGDDMAAIWAWEDEGAGLVRARVFPVSLGIEEDEATGLAGVQLGALLGRDLVIRQGRGSVIHVRPLGDGMVEVGGRVVLDSRGELPGNEG
jgi:predicted PhzF superfamily epimerase YddE/YHI9